MIRNWRSHAYRGLRISNDYRAFRRRRIPRRIARRGYGKLTGWIARRIFG